MLMNLVSKTLIHADTEYKDLVEVIELIDLKRFLTVRIQPSCARVVVILMMFTTKIYSRAPFTVVL